MRIVWLTFKTKKETNVCSKKTQPNKRKTNKIIIKKIYILFGYWLMNSNLPSPNQSPLVVQLATLVTPLLRKLNTHRAFQPTFPTSGPDLDGGFAELVPSFLLWEPGFCRAHSWEPGAGALIHPQARQPQNEP